MSGRISSVSTMERTAVCLAGRSWSLQSSDRLIKTHIFKQSRPPGSVKVEESVSLWQIQNNLWLLETGCNNVRVLHFRLVGHQAMRTPSRNQAGLELLMEYYNQLYYLDQRFFSAHKNLGVHFHWYEYYYFLYFRWRSFKFLGVLSLSGRMEQEMDRQAVMRVLLRSVTVNKEQSH